MLSSVFLLVNDIFDSVVTVSFGEIRFKLYNVLSSVFEGTGNKSYVTYFLLLPGLMYWLGCSLIFFFHPIWALLAFISIALSILIVLCYLNIYFLALIFGLLYIGALLIIFLFVIMLFRKIKTNVLEDHIPLEFQLSFISVSIYFYGVCIVSNIDFLITKTFEHNIVTNFICQNFYATHWFEVNDNTNLLFSLFYVDIFESCDFLNMVLERNLISVLNYKNVEIFFESFYNIYSSLLLSAGFIFFITMVGAINIIFITNKKFI